MNKVQEHLGKDLVMAIVTQHLADTKRPVQLVRHFDEVPEKRIKYPLWGQIKHDGVYTLMVVESGNVRLFSRTGKPLYFEYDLLPNVYSRLDTGVYIAEMVSRGLTLEQLSGAINPNRKKPWSTDIRSSMNALNVDFFFHDLLTIDELLAGKSCQPYNVRFAQLGTALDAVGMGGYQMHVYPMLTSEAVVKFHEEVTGEGYEGVVLKHPEANWVAGHKGYRAMKLVRGISLDLQCVDVVYGKGKRKNVIGALVMLYNGNKFNADLGKGWTDEKREALTQAYEVGAIAVCGDTEIYPPIGAIWEVHALQESSTGKALRLPKVVRMRHDKDYSD